MPLQFLIAMWGAWIGLEIIVASEALGTSRLGAGEKGHYGTAYGDGPQYGSGADTSTDTPVQRRVVFLEAQA
jgi:hypothetical protein